MHYPRPPPQVSKAFGSCAGPHFEALAAKVGLHQFELPSIQCRRQFEFGLTPVNRPRDVFVIRSGCGHSQLNLADLCSAVNASHLVSFFSIESRLAVRYAEAVRHSCLCATALPVNL